MTRKGGGLTKEDWVLIESALSDLTMDPPGSWPHDSELEQRLSDYRKLREKIQKGGGRESGAKGETENAHSAEVPSKSAANPAVESLADFIIPKAAVNTAERVWCSGCSLVKQHPKHAEDLHERIRALEAERDSFRGHWQFEYARAEHAEAELKR